MRNTARLGLGICLLLLICIDIVLLAYAASGLAKFSSGKVSRYGLRLVENAGLPISDAEIQQTILVIRERLDEFGIDSPLVERSEAEGETIALLIPPVANLDRVLHVLNADSNLQFRPVAKGAQIPYRTKLEAESMANSLAGDQYDVVSYSDFAEKGWVILEKAALVTNHEIRDATAAETEGLYGVNLLLTVDAGKRLADWTGEHVGDYLAIVLNNEVKSAPRVQNQIHDRVQITGAFSRQTAEDLALVMRSGPLPRRLSYVSEQVVPSNRWTRKYGILTAVFAVALAILVGLCYRLVRARPSRKSNQNRLPE